MLKNKKKVFNVVKIVLQILAGIYMVIVAALAACVLFAIFYMISMVVGGTTIISPFIICAAIFAVCFFTFRHIQDIFFNSKKPVNTIHLLLSLKLL